MKFKWNKIEKKLKKKVNKNIKENLRRKFSKACDKRLYEEFPLRPEETRAFFTDQFSSIQVARVREGHCRLRVEFLNL